METMIQNSSKQMLIRGIHTIWTMKTENWVISLKTHLTQTISKQLYQTDLISHSQNSKFWDMRYGTQIRNWTKKTFQLMGPMKFEFWIKVFELCNWKQASPNTL